MTWLGYLAPHYGLRVTVGSNNFANGIYFRYSAYLGRHLSGCSYLPPSCLALSLSSMLASSSPSQYKLIKKSQLIITYTATVLLDDQIVARTTPNICSTATACVVLETWSWNRDSYDEHLGFLRYLEHGKSNDSGMAAVRRTAGRALCSNAAPDTGQQQILVTTNNAIITRSRDRQSLRFLDLK
jgi:hypothetical protein